MAKLHSVWMNDWFVRWKAEMEQNSHVRQKGAIQLRVFLSLDRQLREVCLTGSLCLIGSLCLMGSL